MPYNIAFYVHHHGNGHFMRCLAIAKALQQHNITFMGSNLTRFQSRIPSHIQCIDLPMDVSAAGEAKVSGVGTLTGLHYAPLHIDGQSRRVLKMTQHFCAASPVLLIVDVSVEVAMLAQLCGVPFIYIRQHGLREDLAHTIAYRNAQSVIAPFHNRMDTVSEVWLQQKIFYSGCFSRFSPNKLPGKPKVSPGHVLILTGAGGTSIDSQLINHIAAACPSWNFLVIGLESIENAETNIDFFGVIDDPSSLLDQSDMVIGNCGHNTVMEVATFKKPFIAIPEQRPFNEQYEKAAILQRLGLAEVITPDNLYEPQWDRVLSKVVNADADWGSYLNNNATGDIASHIESIYAALFQS